MPTKKRQTDFRSTYGPSVQPDSKPAPARSGPAATPPRNRGVEDAITEGADDMVDAVARRAKRVKKRP